MLVLSACEMVPPPANTPVATIPSLPPDLSTLAATLTVAATDTVAAATPTQAASPTQAVTNVTNFPDPAGYAWQPYASGLNQPTDIQNAGDGSGRLFVLEKAGRIMIVQNGQVNPQPFLDITSQVKSDGSEQGLLGLAFHPNYSQSGLFYVYYIDLDGNSVIARFQVSSGDPNQADPASRKDLLHVQQPYPNHNGGQLAFGPDGYLYIGLGDGGSEGDPQRNGQNLQTLLAKILRIDVDHGDPYAIPPDNPYARGGGLPEIWAYGLRNPWRFSFDRPTGNLYIADVGQDTWEEVDFIPAGTPGGLNFGWSIYEGSHPYNDQPAAGVNYTMPVTEYSHTEGGCSVSGGYVYRGAGLPAWQGVYFYGDYCSGKVWGLLNINGTWQSKLLFETGASISTFGRDEAGQLYLADIKSGNILKLGPKQ